MKLGHFGGVSHRRGLRIQNRSGLDLGLCWQRTDTSEVEPEGVGVRPHVPGTRPAAGSPHMVWEGLSRNCYTEI